MSPAVITLDFDPVVTFDGWAVRWQVVGVAGAILVTLVLAAWIAGRAGRSASLPRSVATTSCFWPSPPSPAR